MADNTNDIDNLISRALAGEANPDELRQLEAWLKEPAYATRYEQSRQALALADEHLAQAKSVPLINIDDEWKHFLDRTGQSSKDNVRPLQRFTWVRVAAAIFILAAAGFAIVYYSSAPEETRFATQTETQRIDLPDGSVVTLNRNSTLTYDDDFNKKGRQVRLTGEAFFDVTPNRDKPFIISSGDAQVEVVGTSFNVSAYEATSQVIVTVETGVVRLSTSKKTETLDLRPGEVGTLSKSEGRLTLETNRDVNYRSWSTRHIEFSETPLQEVVATLNKTYGANITIAGTVSPDCVVTVAFDEQSLESVLRVLETTLNLTYRVNSSTIEITSAKC